MDIGDYPLIGSIVVFVLLLIFNGLLVALHEAIDNVNEIENEKKAEEGDKKAIRVQAIIDMPHKFDQTVHIFLVLCCLIYGLFCIPIISNAIMAQVQVESPMMIFFISILLMLAAFLLVISSNIAAIKIGHFRAEGVARSLIGYGQFVVALMMPFRVVSEAIGSILVRIVGLDPHKSMDDVTEEEIISMVNEGHELGVIESTEAEMIHNIFEFTDTEAQDIMTHRKNMVMIPGDYTVSQALEFMLEANNSRFPVYGEDIDTILGVIHIKDCMMLSKEKGVGRKKLSQVDGLIREVEFIPETRNISELFRTMQLNKNHMVIVVDEYGQTSGLVTMEDILEEIVGNIFDEYDEEDNTIEMRQDGSYVFEGMTPLEEVEELLHANLPVDEYDTLNGYLIARIDHIPQDDENIEIREQNYVFKVLSVDNKMIQSVHVQYMPLEDNEEEETDEER